MDYIELPQQEFSFLGNLSTMSGEFAFHGTTRIASEIDGTISMKDSSPLVIERDGKIKGTLHCSIVEIYGTFQGELNCSEKTIVHPEAYVTGKITTRELIIYPGAVVNIDGDTIDTK